MVDNLQIANAIQHSVWKNRIVYSWFLTTALTLGLIWCCFFDKPAHAIQALAWSVALTNVLVMIAPSAEQAIKMLAQVAAIRAGSKAE